MSKDDFYTPTDIDALRMENELLAFEVRFLKAQLAESERITERLEKFKRRAERLDRTEKDLVLLLKRLGNSPFGRFLGLKQELRVLEQRYLSPDD